jgi:hypothetical protein
VVTVRTKIVVVLLLGMMVTFGVLFALRTREPHQGPAPPAETAAPTASAAASSAPSGVAAPAGSAAPDAGPGKLMDRPLRVVGLGWDTIVPGVLANRGLEPGAESAFGKAGVEVRLAAFDKMASVEAALARGGADKDGADVALVPLPAFVASYERLRALSPEVFFVVGWSRGREALIAAKGDLLTASPPAEVKMAGAQGEAATFFGLLALDLAGVPPAQVKLLAPGAKEAALDAVDRGATDPGDTGRSKVLVTTADASRLLPFVAIAQKGILDKHTPALTAWARTWLAAQKQLEGDPPAAAREVAAAQGAPEPLALLKRLGEMSATPLGDVVRVAGLSGRGAVTLETLFHHAWRIWRASGVLATPAPESAPVNTAVVAALVRSDAELAKPPAPGAGKPPKASGDKARVLLVARHPEGKVDEAAFLSTVGLLGGVFERNTLRVTIKGGAGVDAARTKKLVENAQGQFDLAPGRLVVGTKAVDKSSAAVEVLEAL